MQPNASQIERIASIAVGSVALASGFFSNRGPLVRTIQTAGGAGLLWHGLNSSPTVHPERLEKTILINKNLDDVRGILGEGDPVWRTSDSTVFPITAGDQLWDLRLDEYGDGKRTMIHASIAGLEPPHFISRLKAKMAKQALDSELRKLKAMLETGEYPTIEGQPHGRRSTVGKAVENITARVQEKIQIDQPMEASL